MTSEGPAIRRLNWGCGSHPEPGWINSDRKEGFGIDITCDIREGLPLPDGSFEYVVANHSLPEVPYPDLVGTLVELRRVIAAGGLLRLSLPNLENAFQAYHRGDRDFFLIPDDDASTLGGKLITYIVWYGYSRTMFVPEFAEELLHKAGFSSVHHVGLGQTVGPHPGIVELDNRPDESFFVEAIR